MEGGRKIISFTDLDVYKRSYSSVIRTIPVIKYLKQINEYGTADQLSRCTKSIPALIAEGYAKRYQPKHLQKYIDDGVGEANEATVHLNIAKDLGFTDKELCEDLIKEYYCWKTTFFFRQKLAESKK